LASTKSILAQACAASEKILLLFAHAVKVTTRSDKKHPWKNEQRVGDWGTGRCVGSLAERMGELIEEAGPKKA
jgi:hypothetical protein